MVTSSPRPGRRGSRSRCCSRCRSPPFPPCAPLAWLVIARAGLCWRSPWPIAWDVVWPDRWPGIVAAGVLMLANDFIFYWLPWQLGGHPRRRVPLGGRASPRRPPGGCLPARRRRGPPATRDLADPPSSTGCYLVWQDRSRPHRHDRVRAAAPSSWRCGSCPSTSGRATSCAPRAGRGEVNADSPRQRRSSLRRRVRAVVRRPHAPGVRRGADRCGGCGAEPGTASCWRWPRPPPA